MVIFEHQSDYSVLLNPQSIESWWRSLIVFKIHARLSNSSSSSSLSSKTVQSSSLVGVARLSLRNVLKSRNLKLAKRLAVKDPNETTKRVGTLHVSLELTSDSREFMAGLLKLKSTESSNGGVNRRRSRSPAAPNRTASPSPTPAFLPPPLLSTTNSIKQHQQLPFAHLPTFPQQQQQQQQINTIKRPTTTTTTNNNPIKPTPSTTQLQPPKQEDTNETGIPIHMYLSINESRLNHQQTSNIYLICRLFWNKEKIRFESDEKQQKQSANKSLCWTLNLSFVLRNSIVENMKNNFMIIEAWGRRGGEETLVGTIKLPLHEFWVKLTSKSTDERRLMVAEDSLLYQLPLIGVDGWISAFDPFTGDKAGEINALLALGSNKQIMNLQKVLFDKARSNVNSGGGDFLNPLNTKPSLMEHIFTICVENINWSRLGAGKWQSNDDQEEMYIKYTFPSSMHRSNESSTWENNRTTYIIPLKASPSQNRMEHRLVLSSTQSIHSHLIETLSSSSGVRFELWCKSVYPNRRERLLARAILPVERLLGTLTATFPVPLIDEAVSTTTTIGELNVAVSYRCEELAYNLLPPDSSKFLLPPQFTRPDDDQAAVTLNVGVLRVYGLEKAASDLIKRGASLNRLVSLENSNLYVKFALAFLNRPQEVKQTRLESSMLTGYSPEYFAYFDVKCPLQSTYNSATRRTVSLAEQIELGHLTFEVWNKFVDPNSEKNSYESLLGTCVVQLDALLDNRIGIRGWLPIRPLVGNHLLASLIDDQSSIGGLEIAIRFCKADDYLKVLDAAKQIGWTRSNDPPRSIRSVEFTSSRNIAPISPPPSQPPKQQPLTTTTKIESNSGDRRRVKCLVEIERAVHLASVYEASTSRHQAPNAFVSFQATASENSSASANSSIETNVCARQTSPFWNYQLVVHISVDYFVYEAKYFVLKVLHSNDESRVSGDKLLGNVSIDLQPLICGLSHISGWYNIQDTAGNNQGQLKVSILPQENLVWLKDLYTKRRRQQQQSMVGASERMTSFCMAPLPPTSNNTTSNKYSDLSINQATTTSNSSLENTTSANNTSNSMSAPPATTSTPVGDLKAGLQQKLDELDRLNRSLKERLDRSKSTSINNSNNKSKSNNSESSITNRSSEEEMRIQRPPQPQQIPISYHHRHHHNEDSTPFKPSNTGGGGGGGNTNHQSSVLLDSFWMSSINSDKAAAPSAVAASTAASIHINILETVKQSSGSDVNGEQNDDDDDGNEQQQELYHFNHHQPQQQERDEEEEETNTNRVKNRATTTVTLSEPRNIFEPSESSQDSKKKITNNNNNNEDDEKTELDQTFNLNTSFEIVEQHYERKNSEQQNDDDEINRIIDCSKLEMNDDEEPAALNREETREVSLFIPSNVKVIKTYENDENEEETNGRNFTVVIPEELNKIDQDESNPGDLESKLPNYFLPRDDMEKSMKRLHFNYKTIDKIKKLDEENGNEEENDDDDDDEEDTKQQHSVKHKSVALLIQNQNSIKKDLNRINKIFHSKFS